MVAGLYLATAALSTVNHCHKVDLDGSLKYQSALLFSLLFEIFFALVCVSMSMVMWYATQT